MAIPVRNRFSAPAWLKPRAVAVTAASLPVTYLRSVPVSLQPNLPVPSR